jgi:hypothetical protein
VATELLSKEREDLNQLLDEPIAGVKDSILGSVKRTDDLNKIVDELPPIDQAVPTMDTETAKRVVDSIRSAGSSVVGGIGGAIDAAREKLSRRPTQDVDPLTADPELVRADVGARGAQVIGSLAKRAGDATRQMVEAPYKSITAPQYDVSTDEGMARAIATQDAMQRLAPEIAVQMIGRANIPRGLKAPTPGEVELGMFIGKTGAGKMGKEGPFVAKKMLAAGETPEDVWRKTMWGQTPSGHWVSEISDELARLKANPAREPRLLRDAMSGIDEHLRIRKDVGDIQVTREPNLGDYTGWSLKPGVTGQNLSGGLTTKNPHGVINVMPEPKPSILPDWMSSALNKERRYDPNEAENTVLHELQHQIQAREGMPSGTSTQFIRAFLDDFAKNDPKYQRLTEAQKQKIAFDQYLKNEGEQLARATEYRKRMNMEERRATPPWESYD